MNAIIFYALLPIILIVRLLPVPVLYGFSRFLYWVLFYVIGYRKKIALKNLKNAFPEKTDAELQKLMKEHYLWLSELIAETFKSGRMSGAQMMQKCSIAPEALELYRSLQLEGKPYMQLMGHFGNWEWGGHGFCLHNRAYPLYSLYKPLSNTYFNKFILKGRLRFGINLIAMKNALKEIINLRNNAVTFLFIADQVAAPETAYWNTFLNQPTAWFNGPEKISRKLGLPVVYVKVTRLKRGNYIIENQLITKNAALEPEHFITETYARLLEANIKAMPVTWLWTHRRWKHKPPADFLKENA